MMIGRSSMLPAMIQKKSPRRSTLCLYATRTMQGRRPFIGNKRKLQGLQRAIEFNSHRSYEMLCEAVEGEIFDFS